MELGDVRKEMPRNTARASLVLCLILVSVYAAAIRFPMNEALASDPFPTNRPVLFTYPDVISRNKDDVFTVSVKIFNLTNNVYQAPDMKVYPLGNLFGLSMNFSWNPSVLEYQTDSLVVKIPYDDWIPDGVLRAPAQSWPGNVLDPVAGYYNLEYSSYGESTPVFNNKNKNNTVFDISFKVLKSGACNLTLTDVWLVGPKPGDLVYHEGYVIGSPGTGRGAIFTTPSVPVAKFRVWPADLYPAVNKPVLFNASESSDPDGNIQDYVWDFGDGSSTTVSTNTTEHTYTSAGIVKATLKVRDNEGAESLPVEKFLQVVEKRDIWVESIYFPATPYSRKHTRDNATIYVDVFNNSTDKLGSFTQLKESFEVSTYYNSTPTGGWMLIGKQSVANLSYNLRLPLVFTWNTSGTPLPPAAETYYYQILANATSVPHEANTTNNSMKSLHFILVRAGDTHEVALTASVAFERPGGLNISQPFIRGENVTIRFYLNNIGTVDQTNCRVTLSIAARNGTLLLPLEEWPNVSVGSQSRTSDGFSTVDLPAAYCNITLQVYIPQPVDPNDFPDNATNNRYSIEVRVVKPPITDITYSQNIYANETATFDGTPSIHQDPEGQIQTYSWQITMGGSSDTRTGSSIEFAFTRTGNATVRLTITDSFGLPVYYDPQSRPAASAYMKEITVSIQSRSGGGILPIDPIYLVAAIIVVAIVLVVAFKLLRKPKPSP